MVAQVYLLHVHTDSENKCIDITNLIHPQTPSAPYDVTENKSTDIQDYFVSSLCKELQVRPEQAHSLLTSGRGYLYHIIVNGIKDNYEPVIKWVQNIFSTSDNLLLLLV